MAIPPGLDSHNSCIYCRIRDDTPRLSQRHESIAWCLESSHQERAHQRNAGKLHMVSWCPLWQSRNILLSCALNNTFHIDVCIVPLFMLPVRVSAITQLMEELVGIVLAQIFYCKVGEALCELAYKF